MTRRHDARHAAPRVRHVRPGFVSLTLVLTTLIATMITGFTVPSHWTLIALTSEQADEAHAQELEIAGTTARDTARLASDRAQGNTSRSAARGALVTDADHDPEAEAIAAAAARSKEQTDEWLTEERARRTAVDATAAALELEAAQADPQSAARILMPEFGFTSDAQWQCLQSLWMGESDWRWWAENPSSGAYGIPQSLPADKMAAAGDAWRTNPVTQIRWGLEYIKLSYGTPCGAWEFWQAQDPHWY